MSVIRVIKNGNYTVMSNYHLRDQSLSLKAIGLLSKMLSLPEDWDYSVAGLSCICMESKAAISTALKELEAAGYLVRELAHNEAGKFAGCDYTLFERPEPDRHETEPGSIVRPPFTDFPSTVFTSTENRPQLNIEKTNKEKQTPPKAPRGARESANAPEWNPERFARLWDYYPCGRSKQAAIKAWDKLKPSDALIDTIARALRRQVASDEWQRGVGIPYLATYLNQRRWEDEDRSLPESEPDTAGSYWAPDPEVY